MRDPLTGDLYFFHFSLDNPLILLYNTLKMEKPSLNTLEFRTRPKRQKVGSANLLMETSTIASYFGTSIKAAHKFLRDLQVPVLYVGDNSYFNAEALDKVMYYITRHGGQGFAAPGSDFKNHHGNSGQIPTTMTDEDMEKMEDPVFVAEWLTIRSKNQHVSVLVGELRKRAEEKKSYIDRLHS